MSDPVEQFFSGGSAPAPRQKKPLTAVPGQAEILQGEHADEQKRFIDYQAQNNNQEMRRSLENLDSLEREMKDHGITPPLRTVGLPMCHCLPTRLRIS